ncbi:MAG TPA: lipopolysaccharide kinase InaA family protein [Candidatus Binataceae bacterium]|nr:lipopolysaccharide kinase InaA family protein [Candidatus Binataceae bacterium]
MRKHLLFARSPEWAAVAQRVDSLIAAPEFRTVKDEARTHAGLAAVGKQQVFVKRFDSGSWLNGWIERIRGSRAARSLKGAALLASAGFAHPAPIVALEARSVSSVRASYLIGEALDRARPLSQFIDRRVGPERRDFRWRQQVSRCVAREVRRLHESGLYSSDLQETNLMVEQVGGDFRVYFVDLDGFHRLPRVPWKYRERNLIQLDRSVGRFVSRAQRIRFLLDYLGARPARNRLHAMVGDLLERSRRKEREYQRRRKRRTARASLQPTSAPER